MTIDLEKILARICPLRKLEMAFQSITISKFSGEACPPTPVVVKNDDFMYLRSWTACVNMVM